MERTLIKQGHSGFTVYLPKDWVLRNKLGAGDKIELLEEGGTLTIRSSLQTDRTMDMQKIVHTIRNVLLQSFRTGTKKLTLKNLSKKQYDEVKAHAEELLPHIVVGAYVEGQCTLEEVLEQSSAKFDILLRKLLYVLDETRKLMHGAIFNGDEVCEQILDLSSQADVLVTLCKNALFTGSGERDRALYWEFLTLLIFIEHGYRYLAVETGKQSTDDVKELFTMTEGHVAALLTAFTEKDIHKLDSIKTLKTENKYGSIHELFERREEGSIRQLYHLREILRLTHMGMVSALSILLVEGN